MKAIYLIAAHYEPAQYKELLDALAPAIIVTHVDRKVDAEPFHEIASQYPNVVFVPLSDRIDVLWGGWSQVAATLAMLAVAKAVITPEDYVILLSGDSYPLQSPDRIESYLRSHGRAQYINSVSMPSVTLSKPMSRITHAYLEYDPRNGKKNLLRRVFNKVGWRRRYLRAFAGRQPRAGSTWWALTGEAVLWLMRDIERDTRFMRFCRLAKMPDEFFFQTILGASPYASQVRNGLMFTDWSRKVGPKPAILDGPHVDELRTCSLFVENSGYGPGVALFARKVLDQRISARIRAELWPTPIPKLPI